MTFDSEGVVLLLPRSKEDQLGRGAHTRIPFGQDQDTSPWTHPSAGSRG